jgi:hypothetical protein
VFIDGKRIGRIQYQRKPKRPVILCTTMHDASACGVLGIDVGWLKRKELECRGTKLSSYAPCAVSNDG